MPRLLAFGFVIVRTVSKERISVVFLLLRCAYVRSRIRKDRRYRRMFTSIWVSMYPHHLHSRSHIIPFGYKYVHLIFFFLGFKHKTHTQSNAISTVCPLLFSLLQCNFEKLSEKLFFSFRKHRANPLINVAASFLWYRLFDFSIGFGIFSLASARMFNVYHIQLPTDLVYFVGIFDMNAKLNEQHQQQLINITSNTLKISLFRKTCWKFSF